jgi:hypothetical protein
MVALKRGLPNPIITVAEYLATDGYGFLWGPGVSPIKLFLRR